MAQVLPFPLARRSSLVRSQAQWFAQQSPSAAESNLRHQLDRQRDALTRKGVSERNVEQQVAELESAIRNLALQMVVAEIGR